MQDNLDDLLHLGNLVFPEDTSTEHLDLLVHRVKAPYVISEEDRIVLERLLLTEIQEWCLSRIAEHQNQNRNLRELYGSGARSAISKTKSYVRALRSAYNDAAPINQHLPPEVLMEIFSNVHPAVVPQRRVPVLRVCRYWRQLVLKTPQFWSNLLSLPSWKTWNPKHHMGRFGAAMARSAPQTLALWIPNFWAIDTLTPHATRLSSLKVGPTEYSVGYVAKLFEEHMPRLTHLTILHTSWYYATTLTLNFPLHPNIQLIECQRTSFYIPVAPCASLRHLKLVECTIKPSSTTTATAGRVPAICVVHNALELFPNLETLSMAHSLSDDGQHGRVLVLPELTKIVCLPRLRHLEIKDISAYIPHFLSHLVFPPTTSLVLEPAFNDDFSGRPATVPLFPGINHSPSPHAELSLYLDFRSYNDALARWETHGAGVRPVRVTIVGIAHHAAAIISHFSLSLAATLAPAPGRGLTELTAAEGYHDWKSLLPALPGLRRLTYEADWTETKEMVDLLGTHAAADGFACPRLEYMGLVWHLPSSVDVGCEGEWKPLRREDDGGLRSPYSELPASLGAFCDALGACLIARAQRCELVRKLEVAPRQWRFTDEVAVVLHEWQVALAEQHLRRRLGHLVGEVAIVDKIG